MRGEETAAARRSTRDRIAWEGNVYVTDAGLCRVQKFDRAGTVLAEWGSEGFAPGQLDPPCDLEDVEADNRGHVYVYDRGRRVMNVFDVDGNFLSSWTATTPTAARGILDHRARQPRPHLSERQQRPDARVRLSGLTARRPSALALPQPHCRAGPILARQAPDRRRGASAGVPSIGRDPLPAWRRRGHRPRVQGRRLAATSRPLAFRRWRAPPVTATYLREERRPTWLPLP